jgi:hypothetical protein
MEYWNSGYGKRKITLSTKNVESTFFDETHEAAIFCFCHAKYYIEQENQCKIMRFEFRFLETHHSTIPLFHHSNCERSELRSLLTIPQIPEIPTKNCRTGK